MLNKMKTKYRAARRVTDLYSENMSLEQEQKVAEWKNESEEFQQDFLDIVQGLSDMDGLQDDPDILAIAESSDFKSIDKGIKKNSNRWLIGIAASLLLSVVTINWFDWNSSSSDSSDIRYVTRIGEQKVIKLSDESIITLNTSTELFVTINDSSRNVVLKRGEAHFAVAKDPNRPFSIDLGERSVTVLGTEFTILRSPDKLKVSVIEGVVSLHKNGLEVINDAPLLGNNKESDIQILEPQQNRIKAGWVAELDLAEKKLHGYTTKNAKKIEEWRSGQLQFEGADLSEVIRELNRYSTKKVLIEDANVMSVKVYGIIKINRIDLALRSFEKTLPIKVIRYHDRTVIVGETHKINNVQ